MLSAIQHIKQYRLFLLKEINELTSDELNSIPSGFNNNIIWNLAHMTCAEQGVCYLRSGLNAIIDDTFLLPYTTNTKPAKSVSDAETEMIKHNFINVIDHLESDYKNNIFKNYSPSPNIFQMYGVELNTIDEALHFLSYHDGVHSGAILSIKKLIRNK